MSPIGTSTNDGAVRRRWWEPAGTGVKLRRRMSHDEWIAQVRAWAARFPQRDHVADDSRESIYGDRA